MMLQLCIEEEENVSDEGKWLYEHFNSADVLCVLQFSPTLNPYLLNPTLDD